MSDRALDNLHADPANPLGLVLSGGGARGTFQVGVWDVLRRHPRGLDREPLVVSGTSAGAINGALIAAGLSSEQMLDFWLDMARRPPVIANDRFFRSLQANLLKVLVREPLRGLGRRGRSLRILLSLLRKHPVYRPSGLLALLLEFILTARYDTVSDVLQGIDTSYLFSTAPFRERLVKAIGSETIRNPRVRLAINTVNVHTGDVVRWVNHQPTKHAEADAGHYHYAPEISVDMVLASSAIPLLFQTVTIEGIELWDGGLLVNTPLAPVVALGARRILPVLVTSGRVLNPAGPMHLGTGVERLADSFLENAYNADRKLLLERNKLAEKLPERGLCVVELLEAIRPETSETFDAGSYLYFSPGPLREMFEAGRNAARHWLAAGPLLDTRPHAKPHVVHAVPDDRPAIDARAAVSSLGRRTR